MYKLGNNFNAKENKHAPRWEHWKRSSSHPRQFSVHPATEEKIYGVVITSTPLLIFSKHALNSDPTGSEYSPDHVYEPFRCEYPSQILFCWGVWLDPSHSLESLLVAWPLLRPAKPAEAQKVAWRSTDQCRLKSLPANFWDEDSGRSRDIAAFHKFNAQVTTTEPTVDAVGGAGATTPASGLVSRSDDASLATPLSPRKDDASLARLTVSEDVSDTAALGNESVLNDVNPRLVIEYN